MTNNNQIIFRTNLQKINSTIYNQDINAYHITWQNKNYLLGEGVKNIDYDTNKQKLQHKLAAYIACSKLIHDENNEIGLVVLCPISMFSDHQIREEFRQYILDCGLIQFELNGVETNLFLEDVTVFSEACSIAFSNPNKFKDSVTGIIDIGGLNCNGIVLNNMMPVQGTEFTINAGSYLVMEKIKKELNKELKTNIQDYQMDGIIKKGYYNYNKEISKEIIQSILSDHFNEIIKNMKANNWDVNGLDIVVTGGGGLTLGINKIQSYIPQAELSDDPIWDNCKGGQIIGEMVYEEK